MRIIRVALAAALALSLTPAFAANPPATAVTTQASSADIDRLLKVMDMQTMMAGMLKQISEAQRTMVVDAFGKDVSDEQRARMQAVLEKTNGIVQQELSWAALEPVIRKVYAEVFSKDEVTAMTAFYSSPEGASILKKSPRAMALTMQEMQPLMMTTMEKVKAAINEKAAPSKQ